MARKTSFDSTRKDAFAKAKAMVIKMKDSPAAKRHSSADITVKKISIASKNGLLYNNPVLVQGVALAPAIVASTSLQNAVALSIALLFVMLPTVIFASAVKLRVEKWLRVFLYAFIASVFYMPAYLAVVSFYPQAKFNLGVFLPLIVISSVIYNRCEKCALKNNMAVSVADALSNILGFSFVLCVVGSIREIFGNGTLWGMPFLIIGKMPALLLPFSGFILIGFFAAFVQKLLAKNTPIATDTKKEEPDA